MQEAESYFFFTLLQNTQKVSCSNSQHGTPATETNLMHRVFCSSFFWSFFHITWQSLFPWSLLIADICLFTKYIRYQISQKPFLIWLSKMKRMMALERGILLSGNDAEALAVLRDGTHVQACSDDLKRVELGSGKPAVSLKDLISNISTFLQSGASQKRISQDEQSWCLPSILKWATLAMYCGIPLSYNQVSCHGAQPCWTFFTFTAGRKSSPGGVLLCCMLFWP